MRNIKKRIGSAIVVGALLTVTSASLASAAPDYCGSGKFCIWKDTAYKTAGSESAIRVFGSYIANYGQYTYANTTYSAANSATSLWNNSNGGNDVYVYKNTGASGSAYAFGPNSGRTNLATTFSPLNYNDEIESAYFETYDPNH